jgi:acetyl esterase/lipase
MSTATPPLSTSLILKPSVAQRLIRQTGLRDHLFPAGKLDHWATHPRTPYSGRPSPTVLAKIRVERDDVDGWPVYHVSPRRAGPGPLAGHLLFLHGGAYVLPFPPRVLWPIIARLANSLRRSITVPMYPLAPEHTYRDVVPLMLDVYRRVLESHDAESVAFMGESAGGGLALALCHAARDAHMPQPGAAILLCPWLQITVPDPDADLIAEIDPVLNLADVREAGRRYAGGDPPDNPLLSPGAGPLRGLPPLTIFTGTHDVLHPDARAFRQRARAEGVHIGWHELEGGAHMWPFLPFSRHARHAQRQIQHILSR